MPIHLQHHTHTSITTPQKEQREINKDTERHRETQRDTERHRETQRDTERHRETQKMPKHRERDSVGERDMRDRRASQGRETQHTHHTTHARHDTPPPIIRGSVETDLHHKSAPEPGQQVQ